jgi:hypothetical protein
MLTSHPHCGWRSGGRIRMRVEVAPRESLV